MPSATNTAAASHRKSYILSLQPVNYSLTDGTNIPPPRDLPSQAHQSHHNGKFMPPPSMPGAFPTTPEPEEKTAATMSSDSNRNTSESYRFPTSPASTNAMQPQPRERRPSSVRRLFSLNSLRQSFSSSRTSLSLPPSSPYSQRYNSSQDVNNRPDEQSYMPSTAASSRPPSRYSTTTYKDRNVLRKRRQSNSWLNRKSGVFGNKDNGDAEDDLYGNKRFKTLPMLPEISALGGGDLTSIEWDEQQFKS